MASGLAGMLAALFLLPLSEDGVEFAFTIFCVFLAIYTVHGLYHDLVEQDEPVHLDTWQSWALYSLCGFVGGLLTGWIGIGIEKVLFVALTSWDKSDVGRACRTAILIVGWLSIVSALLHCFLFQDMTIPLVLMVLPGIFVGAVAGPQINKALGPRNVMIVFVVMLLWDSFHNFRSMYQRAHSE